MKLDPNHAQHYQALLSAVHLHARRLAEELPSFFACVKAAAEKPGIEAVPDLALAAVNAGAQVPKQTGAQMQAQVTAQKLHGSIQLDTEALLEAFEEFKRLTGLVPRVAA